MAPLELGILVVFVLECAVKIVARGARPWVYFDDAWNCFDFVIVSAVKKKAENK